MSRPRFLLAALLVFFVCSTATAEPDLRIHGSNTVGDELLPALLKTWLNKQGYREVTTRQDGAGSVLTGINGAGKGVEVEVQALGSSSAFTALDRGATDIGMASRRIKEQEVERLKRLGRCDTAACEYVIALDGIAVIVHPDNPLHQLKRETIQRIFSGEVSDWSEVGGRGGAIKVYALDNNSGTYDTFRSLVLGKSSLVSNARRDASHSAISSMVARDANAIGFVGLPFVNDSKALSVSDGDSYPVTPSSFSVGTEDYLLARRLYFYLPEASATPMAREFVEFALSDEGQKVAELIGFVSQEVMAARVELREDVPQEYRQLTEGAERLSLNFRFRAGTTELDNKAKRDVQRLKAFLQRPENRGRELMLFGFADSNESMPIVSLQLSTDRADNVADLLVKQGLRPGKVRGYGSTVAVGSNSTPTGQAKNRRVEIWLR